MKVNLHQVNVILVILVPFTTLISNLVSLNKVIIILTILVYFYFFILDEVRVLDRILFFGVMFNLIFALLSTNTLKIEYINDIFYLPLWVMMYIYLKKNQEMSFKYLHKSIPIIQIMAILWALTFTLIYIIDIGALMFTPHRISSAAFTELTLIWFLYINNHKKTALICFVVAMFCILSMTSRTYLVMAVVIILLAFYSSVKSKRTLILLLIPFSAITIYLMLQTTLGSRLISFEPDHYYGAMSSFMSSRNIFWLAEIQWLKHQNFFSWVFGNGFNLVYDITYGSVNSRIWSHNDGLHILMSNGVLGLMLYIYPCIYMIKYLNKSIKRTRVQFLGIISILVFCANFNGLYHYLATLMSLPVLLAIVYKLDGDAVDLEKNNEEATEKEMQSM